MSKMNAKPHSKPTPAALVMTAIEELAFLGTPLAVKSLASLTLEETIALGEPLPLVDQEPYEAEDPGFDTMDAFGQPFLNPITPEEAARADYEFEQFLEARDKYEGGSKRHICPHCLGKLDDE